jgi:hypothetical protein
VIEAGTEGSVFVGLMMVKPELAKNGKVGATRLLNPLFKFHKSAKFVVYYIIHMSSRHGRFFQFLLT